MVAKNQVNKMQTNEGYYVGLDIGTNSLGYAVTDEEYKVSRFNGKSLWGVNLFEESETAENTRLFRGARRRNKRKKDRIKLLQELFAEEISKVDEAFFQRLIDSKFHYEDKKISQYNTIFNDESYKDNTYNDLYPTIYHLRYELCNSDDKHDIRLIYFDLTPKNFVTRNVSHKI